MRTRHLVAAIAALAVAGCATKGTEMAGSDKVSYFTQTDPAAVKDKERADEEKSDAKLREGRKARRR